MTPVRLEPAALRSRVKHSTTEPLRSQSSSCSSSIRVADVAVFAEVVVVVVAAVIV